mmetsp:Transcript_23570/g.42035  ORF Transcript_23570/g.42035 Transcript_23570/m.42035 type:complete len:341 (+) Transcript_23570:3-1025(+)
MIKPRFSVFWEPNFTKAAQLYDKAANKYQGAGFLKEAADMFVEAAALDAREQYHGKAQAHYAKAADLAAKDGDPHRACQLYHQVFESYLELDADHLARACAALIKGAQALQGAHPDDAALEYMGACDQLVRPGQTADLQNIGATGHEIYQEANDWFLATGRYKDALDISDRLISCLKKNNVRASLAKTYLTTVVLELHLTGDAIKAHQTFMNHLSDGEYLMTAECKAEEELVLAMKNNDEKGLSEVKESSCFRFLHRAIKDMVAKFEVHADELEEDDSALVDDGEGGLEEDLCALDPNLDAAAGALEGLDMGGGAASASNPAAGGSGNDPAEEDEEEDLC